MMHRIEAGETLATVNRAALSNNIGFASDCDRQRAMEAVERRAADTPPPAPVKASPADLASMGVGIRPVDGDASPITDLDAWLGNNTEKADG
jgi:hypothetical protein